MFASPAGPLSGSSSSTPSASSSSSSTAGYGSLRRPPRPSSNVQSTNSISSTSFFAPPTSSPVAPSSTSSSSSSSSSSRIRKNSTPSIPSSSSSMSKTLPSGAAAILAKMVSSSSSSALSSATSSSSPANSTNNNINSPTAPSLPPSTSFHTLPSSSSHSRLSSLLSSFLSLSSEPNPNILSVDSTLQSIRSHVLFEGIPNDSKSNTSPSLRGKIWQLMLCVSTVSSSEYLELISHGECQKYMKIRGDSFRTFPKDEEFQSLVKEQEIVRVLNSFVHQHSPKFTYSQGMNTICAPFLYTMPEVEAYYTFAKVITQKIPLYYLSSHIGVESGCKLVDSVLEVVDGELYSHLLRHHLQAYVYAFHCVSSLSASIPPFTELLHLWDFLITFGLHYNILCCVAQVIALRTALLESENPKEILDYRKWPKMKAKYIIGIAMGLVGKISAELYEKICSHGWDEKVAFGITGRKVEKMVEM